MHRLECSVWNNGSNGWGLKVLGGPGVRKTHFKRTQSPILVQLDGVEFPCNIDKDSFWTHQCGELINVHLRNWMKRNSLAQGEHVWLEILEPYRRFRANRMTVTKEAA